MRGEHHTIVSREARQGTPLIPRDGQRLLQHAPSVRQTDNPQFVTPALKLGRNDRYAMSRLGKCQQGVRVPTLEQDRRLQTGHAACGIERAAKPEPGVQQQQRKPSKVSDLDGTMGTKWRRGMAYGQQLHGSKRKAAEVLFIQLDCVQQVLAEMDFPAFEHRQYLAARTLGNLHLNPGISFRIQV